MKGNGTLRSALLLVIMILLLGSCRSYRSNSSSEELSGLLARAVIEDGSYYLLPEGVDAAERALIFYPGGLVRPEAYLPLLAEITDTADIPTVLIPMPLDLAVLAPRRALKVLDTPPQFLTGVTQWYVGGHSLGGAMATELIGDEAERFAGLFLLASYPADSNDLTGLPLPVISISAEYDTVASGEEIEASRQRLPEDTLYAVIPGGNHAGFGDYGPQSGDGVATITAEKQWELTAELIAGWLQP